MNTRTKLAALILAVIVSSYVVATGAPSENSAAGPAADGTAIFAAKCALCHGKDGRGLPNWRAKGQPDFTDAQWQKSRTDSQLADITANGKGKFMPSFKAKLSADEITAVVARIRALGKK